MVLQAALLLSVVVLLGLLRSLVGRESLISVGGVVAAVIHLIGCVAPVYVGIVLIIPLTEIGVISVGIGRKAAVIAVISLTEAACVGAADRLVAVSKNEDGNKEAENNGKDQQKRGAVGVEIIVQIIKGYVEEYRIGNACRS